MEVYRAIKNRRSVRKYKKDPVPREVLMRVLEAANWAPSGMNLQQWEFIVVSGEKKEKLGNSYVQIATPYVAAWDDEERKNNFLKFAATYGDAPVVIVVLYPRSSKTREQHMHLQSASAAMQNLLLAAWAEGLGTCWMTGPLVDEEAMRRILAIGEDKEILAVTPLGYPAMVPQAPPRIDPELKKKITWIE